MSAVGSLAFPGGRTLAAWWRQLGGTSPETLCVGYLTIHSVETLVETLQQRKLPQLELLVLKAANAFPNPLASAALAQWLGLDAPLLQRILWRLAAERLLGHSGAGPFHVTEAGRAAQSQGTYPRFVRERRVLHFLHSDWTAPPSSRFVDLRHAERMAWLPAPETPLAAEQLQCTPAQLDAWKRRGFSEEIQRVFADPAAGWEQVPIAKALRCFAVVVRSRAPTGVTSFTGWEVNPRNWELHVAQPALQMPDEGDGWFPPPLAEETWRQAVVEWARQRELPGHQTLRFALRVEGCRLLVEAPAEWRERLRGETWLLAGDGPLRRAGRLEFV